MYESCFLQTRLPKTLNVSVDQKTRMSFCFKTCALAFETLSQAFETLGRAFKTLGWASDDLRENQKLGRVFVL